MDFSQYARYINDRDKAYKQMGYVDEKHIINKAPQDIYEFEINDNNTLSIRGLKDSTIRCADIPNVVENMPVTEIYGNAFTNNFVLESVIFPRNMKYINARAFNQCRNLRYVTFTGTPEMIGAYAFTMCTSLTSITLPKKLKFIDITAFDGCYNLEQIILPDYLVYGDKDKLVHTLTHLRQATGCSNITFTTDNNIIKSIS